MKKKQLIVIIGPLAAEHPATAIFFFLFLFFSFWLFVFYWGGGGGGDFSASIRTFKTYVAYMVLGYSYLSARKILALGPSMTFCM